MVIIVNCGERLPTHSEIETFVALCRADDWQHIAVPQMAQDELDKLGEDIFSLVSSFTTQLRKS